MADIPIQTQHSIRQMSRAVRAFADNELRRAMVKASRDAARVAVPHIQMHVPVERGTLRRNIKAAGSKTIPKIKAGTRTRGGPYAWLVHHGHKLPGGGQYKGVAYLRLGIKEAYGAIRKKYLDGQRKAAIIFNRSTERKAAKLGRVSV